MVSIAHIMRRSRRPESASPVARQAKVVRGLATGLAAGALLLAGATPAAAANPVTITQGAPVESMTLPAGRHTVTAVPTTEGATFRGWLGSPSSVITQLDGQGATAVIDLAAETTVRLSASFSVIPAASPALGAPAAPVVLPPVVVELPPLPPVVIVDPAPPAPAPAPAPVAPVVPAVPDADAEDADALPGDEAADEAPADADTTDDGDLADAEPAPDLAIAGGPDADDSDDAPPLAIAGADHDDAANRFNTTFVVGGSALGLALVAGGAVLARKAAAAKKVAA